LTVPAIAVGAPDPPVADPMLLLLQQKGLLSAQNQEKGSAMVQQMRDAASEMVLSAMNFLGVPYKRGGASADGFDCSGFTRFVFEHSLGLVLPRRSDEQAHAAGLQPVRREELKPGDLVFFNTLRFAFSHVGIYIGDGRFIHSPRTGAQVRIEDMRLAYWERRFDGARRAAMPGDGTSPVSASALSSAAAKRDATRDATRDAPREAAPASPSAAADAVAHR